MKLRLPQTLQPLLLLCLVIVMTIACNLTVNAQPKFEFRAVWIATVENIDWPSKRTLSVEAQKAEFIRLLDLHQRNGMNAIIMQIRPTADAFYPSTLEPWSEYLTGTQGRPPTPFYDPLQFMIEETHRRGMEFHAWLNPYRAVFNVQKSSVAPTHITKVHPDWFITFEGKKYFDPGEPEVLKHVARVVKDIVSRYDVDAIHMDDYFYPYRVPGKDFPDQKNYAKYPRGLNKDDWRRSNCDSIIKLLHETIRNERPTVKFGISPFGVWRNSSKDPMGSNTKAGQTNYDDLYADILLWMREGWIDYVVPQLYWETGHKLCDYELLTQWWAANSYGKHVYIGHGIYRAGTTTTWKDSNEIPRQINIARNTPNVHGSAYFSSKTFEKNPMGWNDSLQQVYYRYPSLIPPMPWIDSVPPPAPTLHPPKVKQLTATNIAMKATVNDTTEQVVCKLVLYYSDNMSSLYRTPKAITVINDNQKEVNINILLEQLPATWERCFIVTTIVDIENNESAPSNTIQLVKTDKGWSLVKNK